MLYKVTVGITKESYSFLLYRTKAQVPSRIEIKVISIMMIGVLELVRLLYLLNRRLSNCFILPLLQLKFYR